MTISETDIGISFKKLTWYVFVCTLIIAISAMVIDLFIVKIINELFIINILSIFPMAAVGFLFMFGRISIKVAFMIVVYTLLINICLTNLMIPPGDLNAIFLFRDTPPFLILMPLAGLIIHRNHSLAIGALYIMIYLAIIILKKNNFLLQNFATIFVIGAGYSLSMYFLIRVLEKGINKQDQLTRKISTQNKELVMQSGNLSEINKLLNIQTNEIRKQQKELHRLNSTKDKIISLIAHDLKSPMATLIGFSELLSARFESLKPEKMIYYVNLINNSAKNIYDLLENMLDWGRAQSEKIHFNPVKASLSQLIDPIIELLIPSAEQKNISLNYIQEKDAYVFIDKHMMVSVIRNLIANAIKFTNSDGCIKVIVVVSDKFITLTVEDNGVGMSKDILHSLFKLDKTVSTKGTAGESGTGLGLLVCQEFLEQHNSKLTVASTIGKGTVFSFELPIFKDSL